jgi:hypothetical protein
MSETAKAMAAMAALPEILRAAQTLERAGLLKGETAADVVKRYVTARPEINAALARAGAGPSGLSSSDKLGVIGEEGGSVTGCHERMPYTACAVCVGALRSRASSGYTKGHAMQEILNSTEREVALQKMRSASSAFYAAAVQTGCHPFIEFTGLMNEYIKCCEQAHKAGLDFTRCNTHSGHELPMKSFEIDYVNEKLECIFTGRSVMTPRTRRIDSYRAEADGKPWKDRIGWSRVLAKLRASYQRLPSPRSDFWW